MGGIIIVSVALELTIMIMALLMSIRMYHIVKDVGSWSGMPATLFYIAGGTAFYFMRLVVVQVLGMTVPVSTGWAVLIAITGVLPLAILAIGFWDILKETT